MTDRSETPVGSSNSVLRDVIVGLFRSQDRLVITECRHCGTSVDTETTVCPTCESDGIARYTIR